jgi:hypothetical protein
MRLKILTLVLLIIFILSSTACGFNKQNTQGTDVITGTVTEANSTENESSTAKQQDSSKQESSSKNDNQETLQTNTGDDIQSILEKRGMEALTLIKAKDMEKLSQMIHPDKGIRFSPYGHVFMDTDLVFKTDSIKNLLSDQKKYIWGNYDGSGEPIKLTFEDYYKEFLYDADFITAKEIGYNKILGSGNIIINNFEVYPHSQMVEYHFSGFDPKYEGMDWRSLRLVFEKKGTTWYLVGIIHDQWTI